ncbi:YrzI family small protein [Cytobacillus sp. FJAT-54145]|uniref:YrzI family small protein n=1 Tax=Cytobacillus spartinae TaxID=3299023 RepID=A0ABW6KK45_9BACI
MTLNILFLTITINKRKATSAEIMQREMAKKIYDQNKERQFTIHRLF